MKKLLFILFTAWFATAAFAHRDRLGKVSRAELTFEDGGTVVLTKDRVAVLSLALRTESGLIEVQKEDLADIEYPVFEIVFASKADFERAADKNSELKREIGRLFVRYGAVGRPFDPELATFFNFPGRIQELLAGARIDSPHVDTKRSVI